jgi:hypothetical protein
MTMVNDTISYLDMGQYLVKAEWSTVLSGEWNPLYSALLGVVMFVFKPSPYWEYPLVHALLFVIFLLTCGCFDFFLSQLIRLREHSSANAGAQIPRWIWLTIGYTIFLWSSLDLIRVSETNPDMLIAALFYLACASLIRIRQAEARPSAYVALGAVLALGYLTKSIMFPVSIVCLAVLYLLERRGGRRGWHGVFATLVVFMALAGPYVAAISIAKGRLTISESAQYNALRDLQGIPESHWQGAGVQRNELLHPTRQIFNQPATFEFASPLGGTYPVWYDPSYWYEGANPRYSVADFARVVTRNVRNEIQLLLLGLNGSIVATLLMLHLVGGIRKSAAAVASLWFLLIPVAGALALYALRHIEPRFLGGFLVVAVLCLYVSVDLGNTREARRLLASAAIVMLLMFLSPIGPASIPKNLTTLDELFAAWGAASNPSEEVVRGLRAMGLQPGDRIASLEYGNCAIRIERCVGATTWAHLGRFRIVAEVNYSRELPATAGDDFWDAQPQQQQGVLRAMAAAGARAVVSLEPPRGTGAIGWEAVGKTGWHVRWLQPQAHKLASDGNDPARRSQGVLR